MAWSKRPDGRALLLLLALAGCERAPPPAPAPPPARAPLAAPTLAALGALTYQLEGSDGYQVALVDGRYQSPPELPDAERVVVSAELHPLSAVGDLDGDGNPDAAVVVVAEGGGSGVFEELVAVLNRGSGLAPLPSVPLGDRVVVRDIEVRGGRIVIALTSAGPDDPACCPSQRTTRRFAVSGGRLAEVADGPSL
jgi:hypothetical protein